MRQEQIPFEFSSTASGVLCINLATLADNWTSVAQYVHPAEASAVVKADAYGIGMKYVIPCLIKAGCKTYFVATPQEAEEARALAPHARIFVLNGLFSGTEKFFIERDIIPCLSNLEEFKEWSSYSKKHYGNTQGIKLKSCLHIDSGLTRLGLDAQEMNYIIENRRTLNSLDIVLVMSHLASADDPSDPINQSQLRKFEYFKSFFPNAKASLAASDGMMLGKDFHYDLVRPGYALYGGQAQKDTSSPVKPVVSLYARILHVREIPRGTTVGYSCTWKAERPSQIAVLALGYADGIPRSLSSTNTIKGGSVRIHGFICPIVGRVSMDLITVDVTECKIPVHRGNIAEILSVSQTLEAVGSQAGTIGYEILTRLGRRFDRVYLGAHS